ncbi:MAG TPA: endonuclease/exonuclease/phosphatase family protein [Verrucomicrobiae bacterium]|nr:endonuclease/exonuclease/phosphatase family protein [Verrucomicrobiae bacterium]
MNRVVMKCVGVALSVFLFTLTLPAEVIALWNFNSQPWDADFSTGTLSPSIGNGTASAVGAVTHSFTASNGSSDSQADNSNWRITGWPAQGTGNKSHGVQFALSTVGYRRIRLEFDLRHSNTASRYVRLQYTTNGVNFMDHAVITMPAETWVNEQQISLDGIPGVENNPNFGVRFVTEFQNTATGSGAAGYVPSATGSSYGLNGTLRFDIIIVSGDPATPNPGRTVKWLDYNVWGAGATNWTVSDPQVQAIGRQLAHLAPDVVTLQEIPDAGMAQMPAIVATYLTGYFLATNNVSDGDKGNMVLSRWPIIRSRSHMGRSSLAAWGYAGVFTRDLFEAEIAVPGYHEPLHAFSIHLKAFNDPEAGPRRAAEASAVSNFFVTVFLPTKGHRPYVLAGDFNEDIARPRSYEQGAMQRIINAATGLQLTTPRNPFNNDERTHSSRNPNPSIRFDYILPGQMLFTNLSTNWIFRTDYLSPVPPGLQSDDVQVASDHLPLVTIFKNPYYTPAPLRAAVRIDNQTAIVSWNSVVGNKYVVRGSFNLTNWFNASQTITAIDTNSDWTGALVPNSMFFRVIEVP